MESAATLVHSFVASRMDYCNAVLVGVPKVTTNKLQRVLNAAARVVSSTHKFDRGLSQLLHTELHRLDVPERVVCKLGIMVFNCLHGQAPPYLMELCQPVAGVASRQHLRSATRQLLVVPRHQLSWLYKLTFYLLRYLHKYLQDLPTCFAARYKSIQGSIHAYTELCTTITALHLHYC